MLITIEKVLILKSTELFASVPHEQLADIAARTREITVMPDQAFIREGDTGNTLYVIVSGSARVTRDGVTLALMGERDVIGELAVLDPEPRSASVEAVEEIHLLELSHEQLDQLMTEHPEVLRAIVRLLCRRLREANTRQSQANG